MCGTSGSILLLLLNLPENYHLLVCEVEGKVHKHVCVQESAEVQDELMHTYRVVVYIVNSWLANRVKLTLTLLLYFFYTVYIYTHTALQCPCLFLLISRNRLLIISTKFVRTKEIDLVMR